MEQRYRTCGVFATLALAAAVVAQTPEPNLQVAKVTPVTLPPAVPAAAPALTYLNGELKIDLSNAALPDVLSRIAAVLGITIEIPGEMTRDPVPVVRYGPGPAREVLASLLRDSHWNFAIQDSDADSGKIQSLLLMGPTPKSAPEPDSGPRSPRNPYARAAAEAMSRPAPVERGDTPAQAQPESNAAQAVSSQPPASSAPSDPPPVTADPAVPIPDGASHGTPAMDNSIGLRPGAMTPPATLDTPSITSQLQQMYQQRMQMIQQNRQASQSTSNAP